MYRVEYNVWDVAHEVPTTLEYSPTESVSAEFMYSSEEPYAVTAVFTVKDVAVEWTFARELLSGGLCGSVGEGDVLVSPKADDHVQLVLRSPEGIASLVCDRAAIERFVQATYETVPSGDESARLDLDQLISGLIG